MLYEVYTTYVAKVAAPQVLGCGWGLFCWAFQPYGFLVLRTRTRA